MQEWQHNRQKEPEIASFYIPNCQMIPGIQIPTTLTNNGQKWANIAKQLKNECQKGPFMGPKMVNII